MSAIQKTTTSGLLLALFLTGCAFAVTKPHPAVLPDDAPPDSACSAPVWQRTPVRVTFTDVGSDKQTFAIRRQIVDVFNDDEE